MFLRILGVFTVLIQFVKCNEIGLNYYLKPQIFRIDYFDKCMLYRDDALYCMINMELSPNNWNNKSKAWTTIEELNKYPYRYRHDLLRWLICIPDVCPNIPKNLYNPGLVTPKLQKALNICFTNKFKKYDLKTDVQVAYCVGDKSPYQIDHFDMIYLGFVFFVVAAIIIGTIYESKNKSKQVFTKFFSCFAIQKHWNFLANVKINEFSSVQGLRVLHMFMVIGGHSYMAALGGPVINTEHSEMNTQKFVNMLFVNGPLVLNFNYVVSGWLLSMAVFQVFQNKTITLTNLLQIFMKRYLRLTVVLLICMLLHATWLRHVSFGAILFRAVHVEYINCRNNWWVNLLHIHNIYDPPNMCLPHSWYIATDTQLFIVSLIILYFALKFRKYAIYILSFSVMAAIFITFMTHYVGGYEVTLWAYPEPTYNLMITEKMWHKLQISLEANLGSYMLGLLLGYVYFKLNIKEYKFGNLTTFIWIFLSFGLPFIGIYTIYLFYKGYKYTQLEASIYHCLSRIFYGTGIGLLIFGIALGNGGLMKNFLEWKPFQHIAKLSYTAYIFHATHMRINMAQLKVPVDLSFRMMLIRAIGDIVLSYFISLILYLLFEGPITALLNLYLEKETFKNDNKKNISKEYTSNDQLNKKIN